MGSYHTATSRARAAATGGERVDTAWVEKAWYVAAGGGVLIMVIAGLAAFDQLQPGVGFLLILLAPFAGLCPLTVGLALRRSSRIERLLERADTRTREAAGEA